MFRQEGRFKYLKCVFGMKIITTPGNVFLLKQRNAASLSSVIFLLGSKYLTIFYQSYGVII